jgi:hypothetical protein
MKGSLLDTNEQVNTSLGQFVQANAQLISNTASKCHIASRDLELQVLLYFPRLMNEDQLPDNHLVGDEVRRLGFMIQNRVHPNASWYTPPSDLPSTPRDTSLVEIHDEDARVIHERFHYLSSFRQNSFHIGLRTLEENHLMALVTLSPFDLEHVAAYLPSGIKTSQVMVVSRVYCFDWSPRNTISYLLSRAIKWIRRRAPSIKMVLTYVNPNLGFTGASYKAANWVVFGRELGTRYAYLDNQYVTDRNLASSFGTSDPRFLRKYLGTRFEVSTIGLNPLLLYAYFSDKGLREYYLNDFEYNFERP